MTFRAKVFFRSFFLQTGFNDEHRQGLGFAWAIDPALENAYCADAAGLSAARVRHLSSFNAQPYVASLPLGVAATLEARNAARGSKAGVPRDFKQSLGAALSGAADAFFWGSLRPLAMASAVAIALIATSLGVRHPLAAGAGVGLLVFNLPAFWLRWKGLDLGLREAEAAAVIAARFPAQMWVRVARWAALAMVLIASVAAGFSLAIERPLAAGALVFGAIFGRFGSGPLRLVAMAVLLGVAATALSVRRWFLG